MRMFIAALIITVKKKSTWNKQGFYQVENGLTLGYVTHEMLLSNEKGWDSDREISKTLGWVKETLHKIKHSV